MQNQVGHVLVYDLTASCFVSVLASTYRVTVNIR